MANYTYNFYYDLEKSNNIEKLLTISFNNFGFNPMYMSIYSDYFGMIEQVNFNKNLIYSKVNNELRSILINNKLYDESEDYFIYRLHIDQTYKTIHLSWTNNNLDFIDLILEELINFDNFIFGECSNIKDTSKQSNENIEIFKMNYPNQSLILKKGDLDEMIIDTREHWGREINNLGISFIAAPKMFFGESYFKIISKEDLINFKYTKAYNKNTFYIKLFDLYDDPERLENRLKQKEFWEYFDFESKIKKIEDERIANFNPNKALQDLILKMKDGKLKKGK